MWQPIVDKLQRQDESERLKKAEDNIRSLTEIVNELKECMEEMEKKYDKETI